MTPSENWDAYCEWRRTKTPIRNLNDMDQVTEEIDQAIHEFVGEVAELSELFQLNEIDCYIKEPIRNKVIDEAGDILFCGCWVLDAWQANALYQSGHPLGFISRQPGSFGAHVYDLIRMGKIGPNQAELIGSVTVILLNRMLTSAGLLCNSFKKHKFQKREQDRSRQAARVLTVFKQLDGILWNCDSTVQEALAFNVEKLNSRYPHGHVEGGGIRNGKGSVIVQ